MQWNGSIFVATGSITPMREQHDIDITAMSVGFADEMKASISPA
jgi:hypothetical protein